MRRIPKPIIRYIKGWRRAQRSPSASVPDFFAHARTIKERTPVDDDGLPLPWMTYAAICYLEQIDLSGWSVFEYGAGLSTQYWSARAKRLTSVEHDEEWVNRIRALALPNVELIHAIGDAYISACDHGAPHEVIVIDGRWRYDCAMACLRALSPAGMVVLDNSERYPAITEHFRSVGLIQVDFIGTGPVNTFLWATSIFLTRSILLKPLQPIQPHHVNGMTDSFETNPELEAVNRPGSF